MWLPSPIYQRIPLFWLLMGVMFVLLALYIGFHFALIYMYLGLGLVCVARGIRVHLIRQRYREDRSNGSDAEVALDQTGATTA